MSFNNCGHAAFCSVCLRNGAASQFRNEHNLVVNQVVSVDTMGYG